jgi:hypothetical protein
MTTIPTIESAGAASRRPLLWCLTLDFTVGGFAFRSLGVHQQPLEPSGGPCAILPMP